MVLVLLSPPGVSSEFLGESEFSNFRLSQVFPCEEWSPHVTTHIVELLTSCILDKLPGRVFNLFKSLPSVNIDHCYLALEGKIRLPAQHLSDSMQVISCGKLWARLPLWWGLIWSQWLLGSEAGGSAPGVKSVWAVLLHCLLKMSFWCWLFFKGVTRSLKRSLHFGWFRRYCCPVSSPSFSSMAAN